MTLIEIFKNLPGSWIMKRHIQNNGTLGHLKGMCFFSGTGNGRLLCEEQGQLHMNGQITDASRSYIYEYHDERILIFYNDPHRKGDILHELQFVPSENGVIANHCHLCGQDSYDLTFTMISESTINMKYVVKGPHKDYAMQTTLTRHDF